MRNQSRFIALGGLFAALAVVIMAMGTIIPVATYICPVLCMVLLKTVHQICGNKIAWGWYGAVALLSLLFAPDKEAAIVYLFLGNYPILKPWFDRKKTKTLLKFIYFNGIILLAYYVMIQIMGLTQVADELSGVGMAVTVILLVFGNITFFLLDRLLEMRFRRR